ncbi:hypothetical protein LI168_00155 [Desulfovibrio desulfuricans]|uniref:hypothetical protein n=1 Tax=Desulfovibrio desulfuricans TaxID=876 RepID=UPI001D073803|nr:hypothetical protein [Desulfovibrio desulfuricans]MCB6540553.1 hypothetical protein [Desulfovibrio desulfuricans]MCB6551635.1 hypothetical protein [Desulfovibrio desulfuricans]MCB6563478.1 hypothetical protein [Desulfovibrio desulfuricans]MCB7344933.1 hypothetical protein [Desulfovibrio desulfuricans]MCQ5216576.1 hypothetical protein [Desulfovibrio desulfuricans]
MQKNSAKLKPIVRFLADETNGRAYSSYKYCHDSISIPQFDYDDDPRELSADFFAETDYRSNTPIELSKRLFQHSPILRYFLDGSRKTYKVDDIEYDGVVYPIVAGQICVACCQRESFSQFKKKEILSARTLVIPSKANADGDGVPSFYKSTCKCINTACALNGANKFGIDISLSEVLPYETGRKMADSKYENRAIARIQDKMIEMEKELVADLAQKRLLSSESYLVKDGSLQYKVPKGKDSHISAITRDNYRFVVGASKMFNPELLAGRKKILTAKNIAELPTYYRTPAFRYHNRDFSGDTQYAIWYVRIRDMKYSNSPFAGVLKLEKILVTEDERENGLPTDEIDMITANIINERSPVCYGSDERWANHLYPIYLTESFLKSQFLGDHFFISLF